MLTREQFDTLLAKLTPDEVAQVERAVARRRDIRADLAIVDAEFDGLLALLAEEHPE